MRKIVNGLLILLGVLLVADLGWVNWQLLTREPGTQTRKVESCDSSCVRQIVEERLAEAETGNQAKVEQVTSEKVESKEGCDRECVEQIVSDQLAQQESKATPTPTPTPTTATTQTSSSEVETRVETVDLAGGKASGGDWTRIAASEKWLDAALYGELVSATWQGWFEVKDGNGIAYARLYDATNNRAVDGSEVANSSGGKASFYSDNLSIWRGQNQYFIEVKSSTGYEVTVESPKLKLEVK